MKEYTIIFMGKSGAGKGTQIGKLCTYLQDKGHNSIAFVEAGQTLRDFITADTYTSKLAQHNNSEGKLQPAFLAIWAWVNKLLHSYSGQKLLCVDGAPRKLNEAYILDEMFDFYDRKNRIIIYLNVSDEWATKRLEGRHRSDDVGTESVQTRLDWFNENSADICAFFSESGKYKTCTIHGEQSIEEVHQEIINALEI